MTKNQTIVPMHRCTPLRALVVSGIGFVYSSLLISCSVYNVDYLDKTKESETGSGDSGREVSSEASYYSDARIVGDVAYSADAIDFVDTVDRGELEAGENPDRTCIPNPNPTIDCSEICLEVCNGKDDDCDQAVDEADLSPLCTLANATAVCEQGNCVIDQCQEGYGDCDDKPENGCETSFDEVTTCGSCDRNCDGLLVNTLETGCTLEGDCVIEACDEGFEDCDGIDTNGCEHNTAADGSCSPDVGCKEQLFRNNRYFFCTDRSTWQAARNKCRSQARSDLLHIDDQDESDFVKTHLKDNSWIGANDMTLEGLWIWSNNRLPFWRGSETGETVLSQFALWEDGQPDNNASVEDCAEMSVDGNWIDSDCDYALDYVCEESPDLCSDDANKYDPGQCGCGEPDTDSDGDGFADCIDQCTNDPNKIDSGICGCGEVESTTNADGDSEPDCNEECDDDPNKLEPGICGCGVADVDTDSDETMDCNEECDDDPNKVEPGICGCGVADVDTDSDGTLDCNEECDDDPDKLEPGACGCGAEDVDTDSDGTMDCNEECDNDPNKVEPGACGCGVTDVDTDSDGTMDCSDECPVNALGTSASDGCGLGFVPANLDVTELNPMVAQATTTIDCAAVLNTSNTPSFTTWCGGTQPQITTYQQSNGPELAVVSLRGLSITTGGSLRVQGSRPAVLVAFGNATIEGTVDASADGTTAHAGGNFDCDDNAPSPVNAEAGDDETSGGGGGGFGTTGGYGGKGDDCAKVAGGGVRGTTSLVPLLGGCSGGIGGLCESAGAGAGGGAIQLSVGGTITLSGTVRANGGDGPNRCGSYLGGGGGGSGGAIRIEALDLVTSSPTVQANGGDGGDSRSSYGTSNGGSGSTSSSASGGDGAPTDEISADYFGGGGGGGGYGRIVLCNRTTNQGCP